MATRKNADGSVTVGIIPAVQEPKEAPAVAEKPEEKKETKKTTKK